jgi:hypothetical protein
LIICPGIVILLTAVEWFRCPAIYRSPVKSSGHAKTMMNKLPLLSVLYVGLILKLS